MTDTDTGVRRDADGTASGEALEEELSLEELDAVVEAESGGTSPPPSGNEPGSERATADRSGVEEEGSRAEGTTSVDRNLCTVAFCPIGMALTTMEKARPDAVQHLLLAGREFLLAAKAVIDARTDEIAGDGGLQKIDVG